MINYGRESGISTGNEKNEGGSESVQENKKLVDSSTEVTEATEATDEHDERIWTGAWLHLTAEERVALRAV